MSLYNLHYLEFMATSHDKFWSHPVIVILQPLRDNLNSPYDVTVKVPLA